MSAPADSLVRDIYNAFQRAELDEDFMGLAPTGREGTSVETMLLTFREHKVTRIDVADNTVELPLYLWARGWPNPHGIRPEPIITGVDRRRITAE